MTHPELGVRVRLGKSAQQRKFYQLSGWSPPVDFGVHNASIVNLCRGLLERVYYVKKDGVFSPAPKPRKGIFKERLTYFKQQLQSKIGKATPMRREDFPLLYQGRRRTIYQKAVDSLVLEAIVRLDSVLKTFVKAEKINFTAKKDPVPRVIQPRSPRYNVEVGRYLKPLEPKIYKAVASIFQETTIFKGLNARDSGRVLFNKWRKYSKPVAIGLDASRFDQHVSVDALHWEHSVYLQAFAPNTNELSKLLSWQVSNRGKGYCRDGKVKYKVEGCRMSGDMNTATGNCLIMCALVHAYCKHRNILNYSLANNGDDCVVIMESSDQQNFIDGLDSWFLEMGFNMKVEKPVYVFEQIEFCQTHPVRVEDMNGQIQYVMVRNLVTSLAKDCISIKPFDNERSFRSQVTAVGDCGMALTGGVPIFQSFYRGLLRAGGGVRYRKHQEMWNESGKEMLRLGMSRCYGTISDNTRFSFWLAFGVPPDMQIEMEKYYDQLGLCWLGQVQCKPKFLPAWL